MYQVWRVESRWHPDGVDFWDFLSEDEAREYLSEYLSAHPSEDRKASVRLLSEDELVSTALQVYRDILSQGK